MVGAAKSPTITRLPMCAAVRKGLPRICRRKGLADKGVVIGYDKRFQSENFAAACAEVLAANGIRVWLTDGATPTPVISYAVVHHQAAGAINITASHNPPTDNGFKVRDPNGGAIDPAGLKEIEALHPGQRRVQVAGVEGSAGAGPGADLRCVASLHRAPQGSDRSGADQERRLQDRGGADVGQRRRAGSPALLGGGKTEVIEVHNERNPIFPEMSRPEPIPPNVNVGLKKTVELGADVCLHHRRRCRSHGHRRREWPLRQSTGSVCLDGAVLPGSARRTRARS